MLLLKTENCLAEYGNQNLIYSIGLVNYLSNDEIKNFIDVFYKLLGPGGKLIFSHKNKEKTIPTLLPGWFCDMKAYSRNKEDVYKLIYNCGISDFSLSLESDDFEYIYYFTIKKND